MARHTKEDDRLLERARQVGYLEQPDGRRGAFALTRHWLEVCVADGRACATASVPRQAAEGGTVGLPGFVWARVQVEYAHLGSVHPSHFARVADAVRGVAGCERHPVVFEGGRFVAGRDGGALWQQPPLIWLTCHPSAVGEVVRTLEALILDLAE